MSNTNNVIISFTQGFDNFDSGASEYDPNGKPLNKVKQKKNPSIEENVRWQNYLLQRW